MATLHLMNVPLCEYDDALGRHSLSAEIDELTLTYCVLDRDSRLLCRHLPSLQEARRWAGAYRDQRQRVLPPGPNRTT